MKKYLLTIFLFLGILTATAQTSNTIPFQDEIDVFIKKDSIAMPAANSILFVGSSSFNYWKDISNYFPGYPIINRGFGGSSLTDIIHFNQETILKYKPKQIYIYCGENDIAASDTITPQIVFERFKTLHSIIRTHLGNKIPVLYVSIKPSVARWSMEEKFVAANTLIRDFINKQKHTQFLDVHSAMLDSNGMVYKDIFIADMLHMNSKGYAIWQKIIAPTLVKE
ncbi:MAG: G-D-S-L family lipolytic protein [Chitinophagaceae bacterium]|jgi:lysophospholipase L1-like esterase|nr:G-D-S-L family lipolytic protein [Chitinophagaceae bacterium]